MKKFSNCVQLILLFAAAVSMGCGSSNEITSPSNIPEKPANLSPGGSAAGGGTSSNASSAAPAPVRGAE